MDAIKKQPILLCKGCKNYSLNICITICIFTNSNHFATCTISSNSLPPSISLIFFFFDWTTWDQGTCSMIYYFLIIPHVSPKNKNILSHVHCTINIFRKLNADVIIPDPTSILQFCQLSQKCPLRKFFSWGSSLG